MAKLTYTQWMGNVDVALVALCGLSSDDLADCCYKDMYDDGYEAVEAAQEALDSN